MVPGVEYLGIEPAGLRVRIKDEERLLEVDNVVAAIGQGVDVVTIGQYLRPTASHRWSVSDRWSTATGSSSRS